MVSFGEVSNAGLIPRRAAFGYSGRGGFPRIRTYCHLRRGDAFIAYRAHGSDRADFPHDNVETVLLALSFFTRLLPDNESFRFVCHCQVAPVIDG